MPRLAPILAFVALALALAGCGPRKHPHASATVEPSPAPVSEPTGRVSRPKTVLIVRHAEKPADATDPGLSAEGKKRADALPDLFRKTAGRPDPFPTPDFVITAKASKNSDRPVQTITPLAKGLKLEVDAGYTSDDPTKLAEELLTDRKYDGKVVLVCWRHGKVTDLATALGATGVPDKWADEVYDRVWVVTFDPAGHGKPLVARPQALMPGDGRD